MTPVGGTAVDDAERCFAEALAQLERGDLAAAENGFRQALAQLPDFTEALANLAWVLERRGNVAAAEAAYRQALRIDQRDARVWLNLGVMLMREKRLQDAEAAFARALTEEPLSPVGWNNYGVLLARMQRDDEAENAYRTALAINGEYAAARFSLAYVLLRHGRFDEGWACLEAREDALGWVAKLPYPRWRGGMPTGRALLVVAEAGHGDMIFFCRYLAELKRRGASRVGIVAHTGLVALLRAMNGVDAVYGVDAWPTTDWDAWVPLLSLPFLCRTRLETIPSALPYLHADAPRAAVWQPLLPVRSPRVGLVWKGNPGYENDAERSLPSLSILEPIWAVEGLSFVSLQKGPGEDEARYPPDHMPLAALGEGCVDFADTAAVIAGLDLVIGVDTAVVHLAAAMAKPCWIMLPDYSADWRWLVGRSDSPWYPGVVRLFRQPPGGGWAPVVAAVADALLAWRRTMAGG